MFAQIHLSGFVGNLRNAEQARDLGQYVREGAAPLQGLDHDGWRPTHQAANQLRPHVRRRRVDQMAGLHLLEQEIKGFLVWLGLRFGDQRRHAQDGEARIGLPEIGLRGSEFRSHGADRLANGLPRSLRSRIASQAG